MSLLVRITGYPPLLFVSDLTYDPELLMRDQVPGVCSDKAAQNASFAKERALKEALPQLQILGSHDPAAGDALASAVGA